MNGNQQHQHPQLKQAENKQPTKLAEEEDEFEEFKEHDWDETWEDPQDVRIWETSWDSEETGDRFSTELKHQVGAQK
jgi:hypothetical protein